MIKDTDNTFLRWAIHQIVNLKNEVHLDNVVSIHGTSDRLLPHRDADFKIENGGHLMIINKASEISKVIKRVIG